MSFATSSVLTPQGEVEGVIAIGQDVTVVKELEKRIIHAEKLASSGSSRPAWCTKSTTR